MNIGDKIKTSWGEEVVIVEILDGEFFVLREDSTHVWLTSNQIT